MELRERLVYLSPIVDLWLEFNIIFTAWNTIYQEECLPVFQIIENRDSLMILSSCSLLIIRKRCCFFFQVCCAMHSCFSHFWLFDTPGTVACQAPQSLGFFRKEYWSGLSFPPPADRPDPWVEPISPSGPALAGRFFTTEPPGKPYFLPTQCTDSILY